MKWEFETERLGFTRITKAHGEFMYHLNSDPDVMKYTGENAFSNMEEAIAFCDNYKPYDTTGMGRYSCFLKNEQRFIGWCGLKRNENELVDLGFRLKKSAWGKGYATEAAHFFISYGIQNLGLSMIIGNVAQNNHASIKVLEKVGMRFEKEVDKDCGDDLTYRYKITKEEWKILK